MQKYIIKRVMGLVLNLVLVSFFVFTMLQLVPGDIASTVLGLNASEEQYAEFRALHHLDDSFIERYWIWASNALQGDLGESLRSKFSVTEEFMRRLPVTMEIVLMSFIFSNMIGISFGVLSAVKQNSVWDYIVRLISVFGLSVPGFLLLTLLLILPSRWGYAPPFGAIHLFQEPLDNLRLFLPPTLILAVGSAAFSMRLTRTALLDVLGEEYIRTARSKGLKERVVIMRHAFRNALAPIITLAGLQLGFLFGGSVVLESVMSLPGLGTWALNAIKNNDFPIVMTFSLYIAIVVMSVSLIVDLLYAWLDPRVRYS